MNTLPNELIKIILEDLDWKTILNILEILDNSFLITDIIPLLSKKLKVTIYGSSFKEVKRECEKRNMIVLLNKLGHRYHSHFGFKWSKSTCIYKSNEYYNDIVEDAIKNNHSVSNSINCSARINYKYDNVMIENNEIDVDFQLPYTTVIIKQDIDLNIRLHEWYNSNPICLTEGLPFLNTKPYIKVNNLFTEVEISSKCSQITIEDVLFASRALCLDRTRVYKNFKIIEETENLLILQVEIDAAEKIMLLV